jgi:Cu(I)/Ag(I) efflux system membrane protein CusA/SilA
MVGGILTSFLLELLVYPAVYQTWKWHFELKRGRRVDADDAPGAVAEAGA